MHIRTADLQDLSAIARLYREVSRQPGGIARAVDEVTDEYVGDFIRRSVDSGLILVAEHPDQPDEVIAEIHAFKPGPAAFNHVYSQLTIVVHPAFQQKKVGKTIFMIFLEEIVVRRPHIGRVELIVRESNTRAIQFYQSLGFLIEGRLEMRIKTPDGNYEADIPMGWHNPNFDFD